MVGYNSRCKICNCDQRGEAERMHEQGASLQQIADFLAEHGVTLAKTSVKRHFDVHFAPKEEAAKRYYEESQQTMDTAVDKRVEQLRMLDDMIVRNYQLHVGASNWAQDRMEKGGIFMEFKPMVDLITGAASEFRQALKLRADLLGESDGDAAKVMFVNEPTDDD